jgi:hypothetical protein
MTNRTNHKSLLEVLRRGLADFAYGIDAGNAIRHGLPVPPRRGAQDGDFRPMTRSSSTPASSPASANMIVVCSIEGGCGTR